MIIRPWTPKSPRFISPKPHVHEFQCADGINNVFPKYIFTELKIT